MSARADRGDERGSTLLLALVMIVSFSLVSLAASRYAMANMADTVVTRARTQSLAAAAGGARAMLSSVQRDPGACSGAVASELTVRLNGIEVNVTCANVTPEPTTGRVIVVDSRAGRRHVRAQARVAVAASGNPALVAITSWVVSDLAAAGAPSSTAPSTVPATIAPTTTVPATTVPPTTTMPTTTVPPTTTIPPTTQPTTTTTAGTTTTTTAPSTGCTGTITLSPSATKVTAGRLGDYIAINGQIDPVKCNLAGTWYGAYTPNSTAPVIYVTVNCWYGGGCWGQIPAWGPDAVTTWVNSGQRTVSLMSTQGGTAVATANLTLTS